MSEQPFLRLLIRLGESVSNSNLLIESASPVADPATMRQCDDEHAQ